MHHGHGGYGRYYDTPGCGDIEHGCDARVAEPLARDAFASSFSITQELSFPLRLRISTCNVIRATEGVPSLFFTFFSPTGGVAESSWVDGMVSWLFVPIVIMCMCSARALGNMLASQERREESDESEREREA